MKIYRVPSVPLITCDPDFSLWSPSDTLYGDDTCHWADDKKPIRGELRCEGKTFRFLGLGDAQPIPQTSLDITPTSSRYTFAADGLELTVTFTTPLLLSDLELVSRPCSYIDFSVRSTDGARRDVEIALTFDESHCHSSAEPEPMLGGVHALGCADAAWMGKRVQTPLGYSGDGTTINWGYLYLAVPAGMGKAAYLSGDRAGVSATLALHAGDEAESAFVVAAYDDIASIRYFGTSRRGYWARDGKTILEAIGEAVAQHRSLLMRCSVFDDDLTGKAMSVGGEHYAEICALAYRQSIAGHKLITDEEGQVVFLSKECHSNGCIGTVDISYPSAPLFLIYNPELVRGMLRPVFRFARMPVWEYDFAPHDVGRYPHADGQVYGLRQDRLHDGESYPPYYQYPAGSDIYRLDKQMPVEESGNMLILMAALERCCTGGDESFVAGQMDLLEKWAAYLIEYGRDPGEQLCTDDFAGHLARNVNLSAKAVMGIEAYSILLEACGRFEEAGQFHQRARQMAQDWEERAVSGDHTSLTFDRQGWSLKYNLVWDLLFESELFTPELFARETKSYLTRQNAYGVPLDSRKDYTKSDWIAWVVAMADDADVRAALLTPIVCFLEETPDRVPFSDWYDTVDAKHYSFQNRTVQGGLYMPLLRALLCG